MRYCKDCSFFKRNAKGWGCNPLSKDGSRQMGWVQNPNTDGKGCSLWRDLNKVRPILREEMVRWATHAMAINPTRYIFVLAGKWSKA